MLSVNFDKFRSIHENNKSQAIYFALNSNSDFHINNLINNFLIEKNSFIFESVEKGKIRGRYTIFGKNPSAIWEFNGQKCIKISNNKIKIINGSPKENIEKIIEEFKFKLPRKLPPISSLISGYFSYDIIRYIEKIPNTCKDDLKIPDVRLIKPKTVVIHDNLEKKIFFVINCFKEEKINDYKLKFKQIKNEIENLIFLANNYSDNTISEKKSKINYTSNISKKKFISNVIRAKKYIKKGDIFQVVLSQRFESKLTKNPIEIYKKLRITNPSPFMYFFNFNDFQIVGASPEILVRLRDEKITIRPIAGTRPRGKNKHEDIFYEKDLLKDKKELSEHLMLLD